MKAVIRRSGRELVGNLVVADSFILRLKGLIGTKQFENGEGLWLKPCKSIHTFGMNFSIDVVMLDKGNRVIAIVNNLRPNRITAIYPDAATILELPAESIKRSGLSTGDFIEMSV